MSENNEKAAEQTAKPAPKKSMTRGRIVAAVVVAVVIVAGCGMFAWHNTPSFCGTVCHTPMSKYVADFEAGPVDGDSTAMLAAYHGADADMNCLSCHEAKIDEQVTEGMSWISGNYNFDSDTQMLESRSGELPTAEFCLKSGCHDGINTVDDLTAATADREFNPHDWSQHGARPAETATRRTRPASSTARSATWTPRTPVCRTAGTSLSTAPPTR